MACCWTSPPGVPKAMKRRPFLKAIDGAGVRRGRLPGATSLGCPGASQPWEPRGDTTQPTPGMTGESTHGSLGVEENALPSSSTTATYEVSSAALTPMGPGGVRGAPFFTAARPYG